MGRMFVIALLGFIVSGILLVVSEIDRWKHRRKAKKGS